MSKRRIIIPAAGRAVRFNGLPKEVLPTDMYECGLTRAVRMARELGGDPVIITNREKHILHERVLRAAEQLEFCQFIEQNDATELWGAIRLGLERGCAGGLILPDTVTSVAAKPLDVVPNIQFGVFETSTPERFSVVNPQLFYPKQPFIIFTKQEGLGKGMAWGLVLWAAEITNFFLDGNFDHYDRAFEAAAREFGYELFPLSYYFDLGTFASYLSYLAITHLPQTL